jgi:hypothetical protein
MVQYTITHRGVPVGRLDAALTAEHVVVGVDPLPAYENIRNAVRAASTALAGVAIGGPDQRVSSDALRRGAELGRVLELRDAAGALVPTDFIELTDWPGGNPEVAAMIRLRSSHARMPAPEPPPPLGGSNADDG